MCSRAQRLVQTRLEPCGRAKVLAYHKRLDTARATAPRLRDAHALEDDLELCEQQINVLPAEDLGHKLASWLQYAQCQVERGPEQLALHVDVEVVETCDVWRAVGNDEING